MKAPNFRYARPSSLGEALQLLADVGEGAVPLAGGQSLLAGLNMRISTPEILIDIARLGELEGISLSGSDVVIGAVTRHCDVLASPLVRERLPLLAEAAAHVGHVAIRNRGTFGGSLAYADPAAEFPACAVALGATIVVGSARGRRAIAAEDFFVGLLETALQPGELILEIRFPAQSRTRAFAFDELSRRQGDFAIVGLAALADAVDGRIEDARLVYFGCVDRARVARNVSQALAGRPIPLGSGRDLDELVAHDLEPVDSPGLRAATKTRLAAVLTRRVVNRLVAQ